MNDAETTVVQLRQIVERFVAERDWHQFHTPKNLAMSLAVEAAELMEHFQWLTPEQSWDVAGQPEKKSEPRPRRRTAIGCRGGAAHPGRPPISETP